MGDAGGGAVAGHHLALEHLEAGEGLAVEEALHLLQPGGEGLQQLLGFGGADSRILRLRRDAVQRRQALVEGEQVPVVLVGGDIAANHVELS